MNSKGILNIVMTIALTVVVYFAFNALLRWVAPQWFAHETSQISAPKAGQQFVVAAQQEMQKPLNKSLIFESHVDFKPVATPVATDYGTLTFSTAAGSLEKIDFKPLYKGSPAMTPFKASAENGLYGFVIAFDKQSPFAYTLTEHVTTKDATILTYKAENVDAVVLKKFTVAKASPRIDLQVTIEPKAATPLQARIFMPAPYMSADDQQTYLKGLLINDREKLEKETMDKLIDKA